MVGPCAQKCSQVPSWVQQSPSVSSFELCSVWVTYSQPVQKYYTSIPHINTSYVLNCVQLWPVWYHLELSQRNCLCVHTVWPPCHLLVMEELVTILSAFVFLRHNNFLVPLTAFHHGDIPPHINTKAVSTVQWDKAWEEKPFTQLCDSTVTIIAAHLNTSCRYSSLTVPSL